MNIPANLKYTKTDEWFDPATHKAGLTDFAQSQLSDIVFVEIIVAVWRDGPGWQANGLGRIG